MGLGWESLLWIVWWCGRALFSRLEIDQTTVTSTNMEVCSFKLLENDQNKCRGLLPALGGRVLIRRSVLKTEQSLGHSRRRLIDDKPNTRRICAVFVVGYLLQENVQG